MDKVLGFLGLLYRGNRLVVGSKIEPAIKRGCLLLKASDAESGETMRLLKKAKTQSLPVLELPYGKEEAGHALGLEACSLILILDKKAALRLGKEIQGEEKQPSFLKEGRAAAGPDQ